MNQNVTQMQATSLVTGLRKLQYANVCQYIATDSSISLLGPALISSYCKPQNIDARHLDQLQN